jgi:hypothetical protein
MKLVAPLYSGDYCHFMLDYLPMTRVYALNGKMNGARCSIVVKALCGKLEGCEFETQSGKLFFSIYVIPPSSLDPGVYTTFSRNEYQK